MRAHAMRHTLRWLWLFFSVVVAGCGDHKLQGHVPAPTYKCHTWTSSTTVTIPADVPSIDLFGYGGGGGGGAGGRGWNVGTSSPGAGGTAGGGGAAAHKSNVTLAVTPGAKYSIGIGAGGTGGVAETPTLLTTLSANFTQPTVDGAHTVTITPTAGVSSMYVGQGLSIASGGYYVVTAVGTTTVTVMCSALAGQAVASTTINSGSNISQIGTDAQNGGDTTFSTTLADGGAGTLLWSWFGGSAGAIGASASSGSSPALGFGNGASRFLRTYGAAPNSGTVAIPILGLGGIGLQGGAGHAGGVALVSNNLTLLGPSPFAGAIPLDGGSAYGAGGVSTSDAGGGGGGGGMGGWNWLESPAIVGCSGGAGGNGGDSGDSLAPTSGAAAANAYAGNTNTGNGGCGGGGGGGGTLAGSAAGTGGNGSQADNGKLVGCYVSVYP